VAKSVIPSPLERRHLLEQKLDPARALRIGEAYVAEDRLVEALAFLRIAGADAQLETLRARARESGDAFLLREVARAQDRAPAADEWRTVAEAADSAGKRLYADDARRQLGREGG
jgi:hypothetical protein